MLLTQPATVSDYEGLARFHYCQKRPATIDRAWRIVETDIAAWQRRIDSRPRTVGVVVLSRPPLACPARNAAMGERYRGPDRTASAKMINAEVRTISRLVIDPAYRGQGLGVRLVRHAIEHAPTVHTEALAAMARGCPVFERAGMQRVDVPGPAARDAVAKAIVEVGIELYQLGSRELFRESLTRLRTSAWTKVERAMRELHRSTHRLTRAQAEAATMGELILTAQQKVLVRPVYFYVRKETQAGSEALRRSGLD